MRTFLIPVFLAASFVSAKADALSDSRRLFKDTQVAAVAFLKGLDTIPSGPQAARKKIVEAKRQAEKAEMRWWDIFQALDDNSAYHPFMPCKEAASQLQYASDKLIGLMEGKQERAAVDREVKWFRESYSQCEIALGMKPTFPVED